MTGKRSSDSPPKRAKTRTPTVAKVDEDASENVAPDASELDAAAAKASVHEAIGKLIGDDDERRRGTAEKEASGIAAGRPRKPPSP